MHSASKTAPNAVRRSSLAQQISIDEVLNGLLQRTRWYLGFSGGMDSTVLLALLADYISRNPMQCPSLPQLVVIHINHQLQAESDSWVHHCEKVCESYGLECGVHSVSVVNDGAGLEAAARASRYAVFDELLSDDDVLYTAHHADDQVETLLLRLFRGTGIRGAAAISASRNAASGYQLVRPLLGVKREGIQHYAQKHNLDYISDPSNADEQFDRNFLRHKILPRIFQRWPKASEQLQSFVKHIQEADQLLDELAAIDIESLETQQTDYGFAISLPLFRHLSGKRQANTLRYILKQKNIAVPGRRAMKQLQHELLQEESHHALIQFGDYAFRLQGHTLYLVHYAALSSALKLLDGREQRWRWHTDQSCSRIGVGNLSAFEPMCSPGIPIDVDAIEEKGLEAGSTGTQSRLKRGSYAIRFRCGGEKILLNGMHQSVKNIFNQYEVPVWLRDFYPLIFQGDTLAAIGSLAIADDFIDLSKGVQLHWSFGHCGDLSALPDAVAQSIHSNLDTRSLEEGSG